MKPRFVALDRDGTIIVERHYLADPDHVELLPGAAPGLRRMKAAGLLLIVVTNQSAVGRGIITAAKLEEIHQRLHALLAEEGVMLDGIFSCPHTPDDRCACRKPETGLLERAAREFSFDPRNGFVVGDKNCDIELGKRAGASSMLVRTGYGARTEASASTNPDFVVDDLVAAARIIEGKLKVD